MKSKKNLTPLKSLNNKDAHRVPCTVNREPSPGHHTSGDSSQILGDINDNEQVMGSVLGSTITGCNCNDSSMAQTNHVTDNVTGITGTGHTITVNQCPQELIDFYVKIANKMLELK